MAYNPPPADRAKIFKPFDALAGFREKLAAMTHVVVLQRELSEDELYELDWKIHSLRCGDMISVVYYDRDCYIRKTGLVSRLDLPQKQLFITRQPIPLENISQIDILERDVFAAS